MSTTPDLYAAGRRLLLARDRAERKEDLAAGIYYGTNEARGYARPPRPHPPIERPVEGAIWRISRSAIPAMMMARDANGALVCSFIGDGGRMFLGLPVWIDPDLRGPSIVFELRDTRGTYSLNLCNEVIFARV